MSSTRQLKNVTKARPYLKKKLKNKSIKILFDEEKTKMELGRIIRAVRVRVGMTQMELATKANTTQSVVARLEMGTDGRMPTLLLISRLLRAAGAHLELKCTFDKVA